MTKTKKRILIGVSSVIGAAILGIALYLNSLMPIITGYAAKNLASAVYISGREPAKVESLDLNFSFIKFTRNKVNIEEKSVTSSFLWGKSKAIYRDGFGVTLLRDITESTLRKNKYPSGINPSYSQDTLKWPLGNIFPDTATGIDQNALGKISKKLISDNGYNGNAFAFIVLHKGIPVAESYKPDFNKDTRLLSWSIAKSFTSALVGILVKKNGLDINKPTGLPEWKDDERNKITLNDLLQMQSGLKWNEDYGNRSDVTVMLHCESDMSRYGYSKPFEVAAGAKWYYSSGTANIVSGLIRKQFDSDSAYYSFVNTQLYNKIGIPDAIMESDPEGNLVGSSYLYATARDYARFGLLYLDDGIFNNERILPEGWVKYSTTAASNSNGEYGAFFWLNKSKKYPSAPEDMYSCEGHDGQFIYILPSQELVVVVLGYSPSSKGGIDCDRLLKDILDAL
jgi:CubicO group peptidase (beta-lactamase class C family)